MKRFFSTLILSAAIALAGSAAVVVDITKYGVRPDKDENVSPKVQKALDKILRQHASEDSVIIRFAPGRYDFHPQGSYSREYFISNHDQPNPKSVGIALENRRNVTIDGSGADFIFHGRMLPVAMVDCSGCTLTNFHVDFENPHITQVRITENTSSGGTTFVPAPWSKVRIDEDSRFVTYGEGWELMPRAGIAFDPRTGHIIYRTSDLWCPLDSVIYMGKGEYRAPRWHDKALKPGTIVALRSWERPAPGIFLSHNTDTRVDNVKVHYAEGMGLLAQICDNITLHKFSVCLRSESDSRYFTTQADATHFSGCKGVISSCEGLYEGMMDDAINVHGTYLKVTGRPDERTVRATYMHHQSYGFLWGEPGDSVNVIASPTMEVLPGTFFIESITPVDAPSIHGAKILDIRFTTAVSDSICEKGHFGLENLSWYPEVLFADNIVRNNRARGSLFSTPRTTIVERNTFDHTSGTAILLCGDCMNWFETGACRDVLIQNNHFINSLTNLFQFTEAIISIYPEISDLAGQRQYFHGGDGVPGVVIQNNVFETFDHPILYAKSINGLKFTDNIIRHNNDYPAFHRNRFTFKLQHTKNVVIEDNDFQGHDVSMSVE